MRAFYNENHKPTAQWLRELVDRRLVSLGTVNDESIEDITPTMLVPYERCHFFAGIGGWDYALKLAGWPRNWEVWTGSPPCQPFSASGQGNGFSDERHLWPSWFWLIEQCRPGVIFGEQVASAGGKRWLDLVFSDLEGIGYTCGAAVLGAHSAGAPHVRQRLYWVAYSDSYKSRLSIESGRSGPESSKATQQWSNPWDGSTDSGLPIEFRTGWDGYIRPIESGIKPVAYGLPARVVRLRGYGNAIVPQVAATFIRAFLDLMDFNPQPKHI